MCDTLTCDACLVIIVVIQGVHLCRLLDETVKPNSSYWISVCGGHFLAPKRLLGMTICGGRGCISCAVFASVGGRAIVSVYGGSTMWGWVSTCMSRCVVYR